MPVSATASAVLPSDDDLIAEMAPPMRKKLEADGNFLGYLLLLMIAIAVSGSGGFDSLAGAVAAALHLGSDGARSVSDWMILLGVPASCLILPWHFRRQNVKAELSYRRKHGKWRWER